MRDASHPEDLLQSVDKALALLSDYGADAPARLPSAPLPSLLDQCEAVLSGHRARDPVRTIHHFACTGGTVICRTISAMPNTVLLSEMDPLSTMMIRRAAPPFTPTDLIAALRHSFRTADEGLLSEIFLQGLRVLADRLRLQGRNLVLRDHAHSQFCVRRDAAERPSLREILAPHFDLLSVVTVRHPLDSYAALVANGWHRHFDPGDLDSYARRYIRFLDHHAGLPQVKFETFTGDPLGVSAAICRDLGLPWSQTPPDILSVVKMSGDSGRSADNIGLRPRREISEALRKEAEKSPAYQDLCRRLDYDG